MDCKKLTIAVFVNSKKESGGGHQYERRVCQILKEMDKDFDFKFFTTNKNAANCFDDIQLDIVTLELEGLEETLIADFRVDLVYFLSPSFSNKPIFTNLHYILTIWDLCHRDFNEFPEVRDNNEFENREAFYAGIAVKKAVAIIVDSKSGKKNIIKRYGIDKKRVFILKFLPREEAGSLYIDIRKKYELDKPYIFYPAQFWPHKNHVYILKGLKILRESYGIELFALFSGTDYGNLQYILNQADALSIGHQVRYLGFVEDEEMPSLYKQALALVMPTYFGPTNIPPLEAFNYQVPVCYSNLEGLRDQVQDAAYLLDLNDPSSLADSLYSIIHDKKEVKEKIEKGKKIIEQWTPDDFRLKLGKIFNKFKLLRECWSETKVPKRIAGDIYTNWNLVMESIISLRKSKYKYVLYGNGTIGKTIQAFVPEKIIGYVDIADQNFLPEKLLCMKYDRILISVLGREEEIIDYLVEKLGICRDRIDAIDCIGN